MKLKSFCLSIICFIFFNSTQAHDFAENCRSELLRGQDVFLSYANNMVAEEKAQMRNRFVSIRARIREIVAQYPPSELDDDDVSTPEPCPAPNNTMFTTPTPTEPPTDATTTEGITTEGITTEGITTEGITTEGITTEGTTTEGVITEEVSMNPGTDGSTSAPDVSVNPESEPNIMLDQRPETLLDDIQNEERRRNEFIASPLYIDNDNDILAKYFQNIYKYLSSPEEVCEGPQMVNINSITEHQLYGFFSIFAASMPGPFCGFCDAFVTELHSKLLTPSFLMMTEEERLFRNAIFSQIPSPKAICSFIAPACYENYESKALNYSVSIECAKCSGCMTVTNVLQHRILLQPTVISKLLHFLKANLFHNICAELCPDLANRKDFPIFPNGFTYSGCINWFENQYDGFIKFVTVVTRPERFCSLEMRWCELNEVPNLLHCVHDLCDEYLINHPHLKNVCKMIPDEPRAAAEFLNIHKSETAQWKRKKAQESVARQKAQKHSEL